MWRRQQKWCDHLCQRKRSDKHNQISLQRLQKQLLNSLQSEYRPTITAVEYNGCYNIFLNLARAPMTVAVNAKQWQFYKSGIFNGCDSTEVNHDTYLIGANSNYWRIKNSFGSKWGEYGYIRLKAGNTCWCVRETGNELEEMMRMIILINRLI